MNTEKFTYTEKEFKQSNAFLCSDENTHILNQLEDEAVEQIMDELNLSREDRGDFDLDDHEGRFNELIVQFGIEWFRNNQN
jgi:hypothetical protein